ncbi:5'-nucleotidase domain-containing protein 1-like [Amphiura filiformis]|uniref:5'-nucleotidase domain-containing protein 1-like n=1 Tax=Amphiura filiformis TaxID=82378 RepID=UPI003B228C8D
MAAKTFCFQEYDAVGVDLDHTICKYKLDAVFPLIYESLAKVLVNDHGYSKDLLEPFDKYKDFLTKGLVLDVVNGNFIKLSGDGIVLRATHGTTPLTEDEITTYYGTERQWQHFAALKENLKQTDCVRYFENYFDMPAAVLFARLVDLKDKEEHFGRGRESHPKQAQGLNPHRS